MSKVKVIDEVGEKYGKLTVIAMAERGPSNQPRCVCSCECGKFDTVDASTLRTGVKLECSHCLKSSRQERLSDADAAAKELVQYAKDHANGFCIGDFNEHIGFLRSNTSLHSRAKKLVFSGQLSSEKKLVERVGGRGGMVWVNYYYYVSQDDGKKVYQPDLIVDNAIYQQGRNDMAQELAALLFPDYVVKVEMK